MTTESTTERRISRIVDELMAAHKLPGLAVGVLRAGAPPLLLTRGHADVATGRPVTPDTVFRIGSIGKTMTAIGVMQLVEEGLVELDRPANDYLRAFTVGHPDPGVPPVTVRHLLTHTAGLPPLRRVGDLLGGGKLGVPLGQPVPELAAYYAGHVRAALPPGQGWAYANHGFAALGQLIADVRGEPLAASMRARLFTPLGMATTDYLRSPAVAAALATGYGAGTKPVADQEIVVRGAGSVFSTPAEMTTYAAALLAGGANERGRAVRPETLALMWQPHYQLHPALLGMGLGFVLDRVGQQRVVWHNGGWPGFSSMMYLAPDGGAGVLLFTNRLVSGVLEAAAQRILRLLLGMPEEEDAAGAVMSQAPELAGYYSPAGDPLSRALQLLAGGGGFEVRARSGRLELRTPFGELRRGTPLHPLPGEPEALRFRNQGVDISAAFRREPGGPPTLYMGLQRFPRRPWWHHPYPWLGGALVLGLGVAAMLGRRLVRRSGTRQSVADVWARRDIAEGSTSQ